MRRNLPLLCALLLMGAVAAGACATDSTDAPTVEEDEGVEAQEDLDDEIDEPVRSPGPPTAFVFDGQSLMLTPVGGTTAPQGFMTASHPDVPYSVVAVSGTTFALRTGMIERVALVTSAHRSNLLVVDGGTSEVLANLTATQITADLTTYLRAATANGRISRVVLVTLTPASLFTAPQEAVRLAYNDLLRANYATYGADTLVDVAAIPQLGAGADPAYFSDGFGHHTQAAATLVAQALTAAGV